MSANQLPEILFPAFKRLKRRLPRLAGLPLQVIEHPSPVFAGLDAGTQKAAVVLGQTLGLP